MFRKIPSKENNTSVFQELKKEFSPQVEIVDIKAKVFLERYAKIIFCIMILLIGVSFILTFFVINPGGNKQLESFETEVTAIPQGFGGEFSALQNLSLRTAKMVELKGEIERIIAQEFISAEDSTYLEKAIEQLQYFNNKPK
jgi:hypothetical protein